MNRIIILFVVLVLLLVLLGMVCIDSGQASNPGKGNSKACCADCPCEYYPGEHKGWFKAGKKEVGWNK